MATHDMNLSTDSRTSYSLEPSLPDCRLIISVELDSALDRTISNQSVIVQTLYEAMESLLVRLGKSPVKRDMRLTKLTPTSIAEETDRVASAGTQQADVTERDSEPSLDTRTGDGGPAEPGSGCAHDWVRVFREIWRPSKDRREAPMLCQKCDALTWLDRIPVPAAGPATSTSVKQDSRSSAEAYYAGFAASPSRESSEPFLGWGLMNQLDRIAHNGFTSGAWDEKAVAQAILKIVTPPEAAIPNQ